MRTSQQSPPVPLPTQQTPYAGQPNVQPSGGKPQPNSNLDGMSALLRAGEIVDGRTTK